MKRVIYILVFTTLFLVKGSAQNIKSPNQFLPHQIGDKFTPHHVLVDYFEYVDATSDKMQLVQYGQTYESRPQILAYISTPENLQKLETIRTQNIARSTGLVAINEEIEDIAIVWLSFNVHGNEAAGSESSMPVLYELVSTERAAQWLKNTIVVLDPCINPDGYSRYTHWNRRYANTRLTPDPNSIEHNEPWPGGRTNHYFFDLNRDWAWQTQQETQNRMKEYLGWLPHIHVDFHEMGYTSPYYFAPAARPYHAYLSDWQRSFQQTIGENHAKYFAENGWLFYTREVFDLLYPSYGDTYPLYHGAIGMTYEQGGSGRASRAIFLPTGDTLTLHDRVAHHVTTALSTVEIGSIHAQELVKNFEDFYTTSRTKTPGEFEAYLLRSENPDKLKSIHTLLDRNNIEYGTTTKLEQVNAHSINRDRSQQISITENDVIINLAQPFGLFAQILFEGEPYLEDSLTYDITAWSIGLGYGLEVYGLDRELDMLTMGMTHTEIPDVQSGAYAYVIPWGSRDASQLVSKLSDLDISLRVATQSFQIEDKAFPPGSVLILRGDNRRHRNRLERLINSIELELPIYSIQSSWMQDGPDFGSNKMQRLQRPKILSIVGDAANSNSAGQVWYYLEQRLNYPVTLIEWSDLSDINLSEYNTLILPEGNYRLSEEQQGALSDWVTSGGKIIALGRANRSVSNWSGFNLSDKDDNLEEEQPNTIPYKNRYRDGISNQLPGALISTHLDITHPISYGLNNPYFSIKTGAQLYDLLSDDWNIGVVQDDALTYGFIGKNVKSKLGKSLGIGVQNRGRGKIIYLIDNPLFRGFWEEGNVLMDNALFLVW